MRSVFFVILCIAVFLLVVILAKSSKCAIQKVMVLDFFNGAIFIGIIVIFISPVGIFGKGLSEMNKIQNTFQGNNEFLSSYSKSIGGKGYEDIESAVSDAIEYREESLGQSGLKEIYQTPYYNNITNRLVKTPKMYFLKLMWSARL